MWWQLILPFTKKEFHFSNQKRERGNWWFSRDDSSSAIQCYRKALDFLTPEAENESNLNKKSDEPAEAFSDSDLQAILEDTLKVYNNLAAVQLKIGQLDAALTSADNVLRYQPLNVKALFRKGTMLHIFHYFTSLFSNHCYTNYNLLFIKEKFFTNKVNMLKHV